MVSQVPGCSSLVSLLWLEEIGTIMVARVYNKVCPLYGSQETERPMGAFHEIIVFKDRDPGANFLIFLSPPMMVSSNSNQLMNQYFHEVRVLRTQSPLKSPTSWHYHNGTAFSTEPCWGCFVFKPEQSIICVPACLPVCLSSIYSSHHPSNHLPVCIVFITKLIDAIIC